MKRISSRKFRLPIGIKLFRNDELIFASCFTKKSKIIQCLQVATWDKAYLKVNYGGGLYNDGEYYNFQDCKEALAAFTEKPLLDYCERSN